MDFDRYVSRTFRTVVVQPTSLCTWRCDYCYLPTRDRRLEMSVAVAEGVARGIAAQDSDRRVTVVWHGGEPLSLRQDRFEQLLMPFAELRAAGRIQHAVQTNAGLLTDSWCELFSAHGVSVGVSIDGPEWANAQRRDQAGRPTFDRAMRGIAALNRNGLPFTVIAVITADTIGRAGEIMQFFEGLGARRVGFNLEELEGVNTRASGIDHTAAEEFWRQLFLRRSAGSALPVREVDGLLTYLRSVRAGDRSPRPRYDPIPTVAWNGDTVLLSPELAGVTAPEYGDFVVGNVTRETFPEMLGRAHDVRYVAEFVEALAECAATCEFYDYCRGAQAGNRYFEHGTFRATETAYCVNTRKALVGALSDLTTRA
ncbi:cyclophane-forming radical SAM peptide maturase AmcB [Dactylosporangium sp. NPDC049525]|uniref:cyclophane-forming radical SAM peptide maturase AmcB n=1 Tax=Dactylosporangium sp. NPDC049525 TaxID=3154730 RepID=UPI0034444788